LPFRRADPRVDGLRARSRNAAGFDSRPSGRGTCACRAAVAASRVTLSVRLRAPLAGRRPLHYAFEEQTMARIGAFCITTWLAAAILYFGQHSVAMIALSGVVVFGGFDLLRP